MSKLLPHPKSRSAKLFRFSLDLGFRFAAKYCLNFPGLETRFVFPELEARSGNARAPWMMSSFVRAPLFPTASLFAISVTNFPSKPFVINGENLA